MPRQHIEGVDLVVERQAPRRAARARPFADAIDALDRGAVVGRDPPLWLEAQPLAAPIGDAADIGESDARIFPVLCSTRHQPSIGPLLAARHVLRKGERHG